MSAIPSRMCRRSRRKAFTAPMGWPLTSATSLVLSTRLPIDWPVRPAISHRLYQCQPNAISISTKPIIIHTRAGRSSSPNRPADDPVGPPAVTWMTRT